MSIFNKSESKIQKLPKEMNRREFLKKSLITITSSAVIYQTYKTLKNSFTKIPFEEFCFQIEKEFSKIYDLTSNNFPTAKKRLLDIKNANDFVQKAKPNLNPKKRHTFRHLVIENMLNRYKKSDLRPSTTKNSLTSSLCYGLADCNMFFLIEHIIAQKDSDLVLPIILPTHVIDIVESKEGQRFFAEPTTGEIILENKKSLMLNNKRTLKYYIDNFLCGFEESFEKRQKISSLNSLYAMVYNNIAEHITNILLTPEKGLQEKYALFKLKLEINQKALECDPYSISVLHNLATNNLYKININNLQELTQSFKDAISYASKIIEIDPYFQTAYFIRGCAYANLGNISQAKKDFNKNLEILTNGIKVNSDKKILPRLFEERADTYEELGFKAEAEKDRKNSR